MKKEIFVYLFDEGTDVWRSVEAEHIEGNIYKIISEKQDETENWQFSAGDFVRCEEKTFQDGTGLVAIEKIDYRK